MSAGLWVSMSLACLYGSIYELELLYLGLFGLGGRLAGLYAALKAAPKP